jgi:hypothetical protein
MPRSGRAREKNDFRANGTFNPLRGFNVGIIFQIAPDFNQIERGFRR